MADVTAGAARYASVAEVRADVERAGGDASALCGFGRCFCVKTALGIRRKERGHWPPSCGCCVPQPGVVDARADYNNTQSLVPAAEQWVRLRAFHLHGGRLHRQQPAGSRIRPGRHARLPQADGRANHRRDSRRGGSAAAWRASAQRVSVGDSSSSAGSFFYIVLGARAESLVRSAA